MIKVFKDSDSVWCVHNTKNNKCSYIHRINEYNAFTRNKVRYRVDVKGVTVESLIGHFNTAKKIAANHIE